MLDNMYFRLGFALVSAFLICFASTPLVKMFANRVGAIDVPDETRIHNTPIPRLGGLAIFLGFLFAVVLFADITRQVQGMLLGAIVIAISGVIDDIVRLKWYYKIVFQVAAALIAVFHGIVATAVSNPNIFSASELLVFGNFGIPITVIWIVGMTNAVNLIDGLDGLACGVSGISSVTMLVISLLVSDMNVAIIMAALAGACIGFLPYNLNPAKIFMGDTGALVLGFVLSTASIMGLFKFYAIISFAVPFLVLGLPLFNTAFVFILRIIKGKNPMERDRGHFHDRLIGMGLSQKQAVAVLYVVSGILGLAAVVITTSGEMRALLLVVAVLAAWLIGMSMGAARRSGKTAPKEPEATDEQEKIDKPSLIEEEHTEQGSGK